MNVPFISRFQPSSRRIGRAFGAPAGSATGEEARQEDALLVRVGEIDRRVADQGLQGEKVTRWDKNGALWCIWSSIPLREIQTQWIYHDLSIYKYIYIYINKYNGINNPFESIFWPWHKWWLADQLMFPLSATFNRSMPVISLPAKKHSSKQQPTQHLKKPPLLSIHLRVRTRRTRILVTVQ